MTADTGNVNTLEMLSHAESGLPTLNDFDPDYKDRFQQLQDELSLPAYYDIVEQRLEIEDIISHTTVRPEIAQDLLAELESARLKGYPNES